MVFSMIAEGLTADQGRLSSSSLGCSVNTVIHIGGVRHTERHKERKRDRDRQRQRETETETDRHTEIALIRSKIDNEILSY